MRPLEGDSDRAASLGDSLPDSLVRPLGLWGASVPIIRLRLRRIRNVVASGLRFKSKNKVGRRSGEAGNRVRGWFWGTFLALVMLFSLCHMSVQCLRNLKQQLGSQRVEVQSSSPSAVGKGIAKGAKEILRPLPPRPGFRFPPNVVKGLLLILYLILVGNLAINLAGSEITRPEWDLEWLATLPIPLPTLMGAKVIEKAITNSSGWFTVLPFTVATAWFAGWGLWSFPLGILATLLLLFAISFLQIFFEVFLRYTLSAPQMRNFKAFCSILGVVFIYLALSVCMPSGQNDTFFMYSWMRQTPDALLYSPWGLPVASLVYASPGAVWGCFGLEGVLLAVEALIVMSFVCRMLNKGFVTGGTRESGGRAKTALAKNRKMGLQRCLGLLSVIQVKECRLLLRDRNYMVQTLILPVLMVGAQVLFNRGLLEAASRNSGYLGILAFGVGAYVLMFSAFQTLNAEGGALWMLYCCPQSIDQLILRKANLWAGVSLFYSMVIFAVGIGLYDLWSYDTMFRMAMVLIGIPIYAVIGACLGVFACRPLETVSRRVRPDFLYLYMILVSLFAYGIYVTSFWTRMGQIALTALLSLALWQKVKDRIPYLLDPTAAPPSEVSLADGLIAAMIFFVIQGMVNAVGAAHGAKGSAFVFWLAFLMAGGITFALIRVTYWRTKPNHIPRFFVSGRSPGIGIGLGMGAISLAFGAGYLKIWDHVKTFFPATDYMVVAEKGWPWIFALAILLAPFFEEFIFRGLIYFGLRRSWGVRSSILASAAIFALVHPPVSVLPVFFLGACAAFSFELTGTLLTPVLVHAVYNAGILGIQRIGW